MIIADVTVVTQTPEGVTLFYAGIMCHPFGVYES